MTRGDHVEPVNILMVDDQPAKLITYESILEELGENLIKAASGREALECLLRQDIAVILIDVCMPELDGYELAAMIRQHPRFQKTAMIFVSAKLLTDFDRLRGYEVGGVDYLPVPIVPEILRAKVTVFCELFRKTRQLEALNRDLEQRVGDRTAALEATAAALQASDQRKDEFLATLAHELRGPLAPMSNMLEVLKRADGDAEMRVRARGTIERQLRHLVRLVDDLLDVGRIAGNKLALRTEQVDLASIVGQAVETCRPLFEGAGHLLSVSVPTDPIEVIGDPVRLTQVLNNLLNNSCKYTPPGGRVGLTVWREGSDALLAVRDTGRGIPPELLPRVFEMFTQLETSLERSQGGLGVGLSLVKHLVELHGGAVMVRSEGVGRGCEFIVRLPALHEAAVKPGRRSQIVTPWSDTPVEATPTTPLRAGS
jgi:signal transduction histidine kinase